MEAKGWLAAVALGVVPAIAFAVAAEFGLGKATGLNAPNVELPTIAPRSTPLGTTSLIEPSPTSRASYFPVPSIVVAPEPRAPSKPVANPVRIETPNPTTTPAPEATATSTPTATRTPTATPTGTFTPAVTPTPTRSPTPTPIPFDFALLSKEEQCNLNTPADYRGDLVTGRVLDVNGRPMTGIRIGITTIYTDSPWLAEAVTDGGGFFRFYLSKGNFEAWVASGSSDIATELWTRSAGEPGVCTWRLTFRKTNTRTPVPQSR